MWGHTYVESDDAIVLCIVSFCFAMNHMGCIGVIVLCMTSRDSQSFFSMN